MARKVLDATINSGIFGVKLQKAGVYALSEVRVAGR